MGMRSFQKDATFRVLLRSFAKECCILCVFLRSLQKNIAFFAFFYIVFKRTLRSLRSFGSHKSTKTWKKNGKERNVPFKEWKRMERTERKRTRCPTLVFTIKNQKIVQFKDWLQELTASKFVKYKQFGIVQYKVQYSRIKRNMYFLCTKASFSFCKLHLQKNQSFPIFSLLIRACHLHRPFENHI